MTKQLSDQKLDNYPETGSADNALNSELSLSAASIRNSLIWGVFLTAAIVLLLFTTGALTYTAGNAITASIPIGVATVSLCIVCHKAERCIRFMSKC